MVWLARGAGMSVSKDGRPDDPPNHALLESYFLPTGSDRSGRNILQIKP